MAVVDTCNVALGEIAADTIASIDEGSLSSNHCKRHYDDCVADLLALHDWGAAIKRVTLAETINDRPGEWAYCYAKPADAGNFRRILPPLSSSPDNSYPVWGWWTAPLWRALGPLPYVEDAGSIYTNVAGAVLEYTVSTLTEANMRPLFRRALAMMLAARIAMPIKKDRQLRNDMIALADNAVRVAMADDQNRYPRVQQEYVSEIELVRGGWPGHG
ncbi:hypothetical protein [Sphingomonas asaccharolytica]|uniref:hypothetical protein n=1 Tax=Sphingomonas asaccharolytica TaxID=40681 RepID=UPI00083727B1|nr:hypothetical protein [Sphingomonas asaccharolytica]